MLSSKPLPVGFLGDDVDVDGEEEAGGDVERGEAVAFDCEEEEVLIG
jgi:hypothetical protein